MESPQRSPSSGWTLSPGRGAHQGTLIFELLSIPLAWLGDLGQGLLHEKGWVFAMRCAHAVANIVSFICVLILLRLSRKRNSRAWLHFRHEIGLIHLTALMVTAVLFTWLRTLHSQAVGIMYLIVGQMFAAIQQTPSAYMVLIYLIQVPGIVAKDAHYSYFKLKTPAMRVLAESGAQLVLVAALDVLTRMIYLDGGVPAEAQGGCGPGPLANQQQQQAPSPSADAPVTEVLSVYSERGSYLRGHGEEEQDQRQLPFLAGVRMALWTTAWELQRKEIRLKDRQEHQQQQQPRSQQQQEGKTAEGRAWLHYCAHAHSLLCMLYVGLMWAAEKVWQWGLGKNAQKSTDGPGDLLARSQREPAKLVVLQSRLELIRQLDAMAYTAQGINERLDHILLMVYRAVKSFDMFALAFFFIMPFTVKVGWQVLNSIISTDQHWEDLRLNLPEVVLVVVGAFLCGKIRVEAVGGQLERAQHLLYDLVPRHIANALLSQPETHTSSGAYSLDGTSVTDTGLQREGSHPLPSLTGSASGVMLSRLSSASNPVGHSQPFLLSQPSAEIPASEVLRPSRDHLGPPAAAASLTTITPSRPSYKRQPSDLRNHKEHVAPAAVTSSGFTFDSGAAVWSEGWHPHASSPTAHHTPSPPSVNYVPVWSITEVSTAQHCASPGDPITAADLSDQPELAAGTAQAEHATQSRGPAATINVTVSGEGDVSAVGPNTPLVCSNPLAPDPAPAPPTAFPELLASLPPSFAPPTSAGRSELSTPPQPVAQGTGAQQWGVGSTGAVVPGAGYQEQEEEVPQDLEPSPGVRAFGSFTGEAGTSSLGLGVGLGVGGRAATSSGVGPADHGDRGRRRSMVRTGTFRHWAARRRSMDAWEGPRRRASQSSVGLPGSLLFEEGGRDCYQSGTDAASAGSSPGFKDRASRGSVMAGAVAAAALAVAAFGEPATSPAATGGDACTGRPQVSRPAQMHLHRLRLTAADMLRAASLDHAAPSSSTRLTHGPGAAGGGAPPPSPPPAVKGVTTLRRAASSGDVAEAAALAASEATDAPHATREHSSDRMSRLQLAASAMASSVLAAGGALLRGLGSRPGSQQGTHNIPGAGGLNLSSVTQGEKGEKRNSSGEGGGFHALLRLAHRLSNDSPTVLHQQLNHSNHSIPSTPSGVPKSGSNERLPFLSGSHAFSQAQQQLVEGGRWLQRSGLSLPPSLALALGGGRGGSYAGDFLPGSGRATDAAPGLVKLQEEHPSVSVLMADIVGFTEASDQCEPLLVMEMLHDLFNRYDNVCLRMSSVYKVETIGDCYFACAGLHGNDPNHARTLIRFGWQMIREARQVLMPHTGQPVQIRVGINSGKVMAGLIGRIRRQYRLFGDTVNLASRMESTGSPGCVHISASTWMLTRNYPDFHFWELPPMEVKGKGRLTTWMVTPVLPDDEDDPGAADPCIKDLVQAARHAVQQAEQKGQQEVLSTSAAVSEASHWQQLLAHVSPKASNWGMFCCLTEWRDGLGAQAPPVLPTMQELFTRLQQ